MIHLVALLTLLSQFPAAMAAKPPCEVELSRPARRFLGTLRSGLREGVVTMEDLQWMLTLPSPASPLRSARSPENIEMIRSLREEVQKISPAEWNSIVGHAHEIHDKLQDQQSQVQEASHNARNIFNIVPSELKFPSKETLIATFTTSTGEPIIFTKDLDHSYFYNLATGQKIKVEFLVPEHLHIFDFFESADGEVYCAFLSDKQLRVVNAKTGAIIFAAGRAMNMEQRPLLYEANGVLSVVLGDRSSGSLGRHTLFAKFATQLIPAPDRSQPIPALPNVHHVIRLSDGHLYGLENELTDKSHLLTVRDLTLGHESFKLRLKLEPAGATQIALIHDGAPQLIRQNRGEWSHIESGSSQVIPLSYSAADFALIGLFTYQGDAVDARVKRDGDHSRLNVVSVLHGLVKSVPLQILAESETQVADPIQTRDGFLIPVWELVETNKPTKLHLYNLETDHLVSMPVPPGIEGDKSLVYNPADGRILLFPGLKTKSPKVYQVFGPERFE